MAPPRVDPDLCRRVWLERQSGLGASELARRYKTSRQTIYVWSARGAELEKMDLADEMGDLSQYEIWHAEKRNTAARVDRWQSIGEAIIERVAAEMTPESYAALVRTLLAGQDQINRMEGYYVPDLATRPSEDTAPPQHVVQEWDDLLAESRAAEEKRP